MYFGDATIIMGIVTAMAGQRKEKWDEGVFEYVPYYFFSDVETEGIDSSYPCEYPFVCSGCEFVKKRVSRKIEINPVLLGSPKRRNNTTCPPPKKNINRTKNVLEDRRR